MRLALNIGVLCAALSLAGPAFAAVTITNQDSHSHTLTINRGTTETRQDIAGGKSVQVDCPKACGFHDEANGFSRVAGGDSKLVIDKDAELHFDGGRGDLTMPNGSN